MEENQIEKYKAFFLILLLAAIGGGVPTLAKIGLKEIPPFTFTLFRFLLAGVVLLPVFLSRKQRVDLKNLKSLILVSLLATSNVTFFILGVKKTTATIAQMLYAAVPIVTSIFSYFLLKEKIGIKKLLGVLFGLIGVLVIILLPVVGKASVFSGNLVGNLLIFIAVSSFSLYTQLTQVCNKNSV